MTMRVTMTAPATSVVTWRQMETETATTASAQEPQASRPDDLRERRRIRTRLEIQTEAFRLFASNGYRETTVEEIAEAAAISPRTFFRYFPTKDDVVLWDEYDPLIPELVEARPIGEPWAATARAIMRETLSGIYRRDREQLLTKVRLFSSVPELRARFLESQASGGESFASLLTQRPGHAGDDLKARVIASAFGAAATTALDRWQQGDGRGDLLAIFDQVTDALIDGFSEIDRSQAP
jgi:AcrR family transcriptional regulator